LWWREHDLRKIVSRKSRKKVLRAAVISRNSREIVFQGLRFSRISHLRYFELIVSQKLPQKQGGVKGCLKLTESVIGVVGGFVVAGPLSAAKKIFARRLRAVVISRNFREIVFHNFPISLSIT